VPFGANDLYPGLSVVRITSPACVGSLRETLLRKGRETQLNVGFGRPGSVTGAVRDAMGDPIQDAKVSVDGQDARTNEKGEFFLPEVASGEVIAIAEKPGYATRMEKLVVVAGEAVQKGRFAFVLRPAARLEVTIEERINADNEAQLFVLPESPGERDYPWWRLNPIRDLPRRHEDDRGSPGAPRDAAALPCRRRRDAADAHGHPPREGHGERAAPSRRLADRLRRGHRRWATGSGRERRPRVALALAGGPRGARGGELSRARARGLPRLPAGRPARADERPRRVRARQLRERQPDALPPRDVLGREADGVEGPARGETRVDLALETARGDAELTLQMAGRTQGLPVEIKVDGAARDAEVLPPGQDLHIAGLAPGTWKFSARWNGEDIFEGMLIDLKEETTLSLTLPEGAIVGQDLDTRKRSGK
jgi:hypothetical protein